MSEKEELKSKPETMYRDISLSIIQDVREGKSWTDISDKYIIVRRHAVNDMMYNWLRGETPVVKDNNPVSVHEIGYFILMQIVYFKVAYNKNPKLHHHLDRLLMCCQKLLEYAEDSK